MTPRRSLHSVSPAASPAANRASLLALRSLLIASAATLLPLSGCKDADVEAKVAAAQDLKSETRSFLQAAETSTVTNRAKRATELEGLATKTAPLGASNDQKAAAGVLSSAMASAAASLYAATSRDIEVEANRARMLITAAANAAASLQSIAKAESQISLSSDLDFLKQQKAAAEGSLKGLQDKVKELEGPIDQLKASIAQRREKLAEMQQKADALRREALAAGAIDGFPLVEQSADVRTNAAQLRGSVSLDESQLFVMQPELNHANGALSAAQAISTAADSATKALENFRTSLQTDATSLAKAAEELRAGAQTALDALNAQIGGPLNEAYEKVAALLKKARDAGSRSGCAAAAETKLETNSSLGALAWQQVAGIDAQVALHERLAAAGALFGGGEKQKEAIDALNAKRDEVVATAKEYYAAAIEAVGGMNAESPPVARTKASLEMALARVEGRSAAPAPTSASGGAQPGPAAAGATKALVGMGAGFPTRDELIDAFMGAGADFDKGMDLASRGLAFSSEGTRSMFNASISMVEVISPMLKAVKAKFGDEGMASLNQAAGGMGGGSPMGAKYEKIDQGGKTFLRTTAQGRTVELEVVEINGAWYANGEGLFAGVDPAQMAAAEGMIAAMAPMKKAMKGAAEAIARDITGGTITSADQVMPAFQQAIAKAMQGG